MIRVLTLIFFLFKVVFALFSFCCFAFFSWTFLFLFFS